MDDRRQSRPRQAVRCAACALLDLAYGTLPVQLRNPDITHGLFRRQLKGRLFLEA